MLGRKLKLILIVAILALTGTYVYLVKSSVFAVAERRDNEEKISQLEADVSTLEADYMARANLVTLELAQSLGFVDATGKAGFAIKDRPVGMARN
jgi:sulfur transfer complex TusBCD TusB component (DsrH family)